MPGMDGFINFNGTLEGSIAGGASGAVKDVKTNASGSYQSVVDEAGNAMIDLSVYAKETDVSEDIQSLSGQLANKQNILDYSTEEQDTGIKWIDGKPLYTKTIIHDTPMSNRVWTDIINDININIKMFDGYIYLDGYPYTQINYYRSTTEYSCGGISNNEHRFRVYPSIDGVTITCIVTLYYTKVPD